MLILLGNVVHAASQGKLGTQSIASVEILVTVNQSLSAISPNELLLNNFNQTNLTVNKPFCIAHNGFDKNASVPYELIVDRLVSINENQHSLPFNIFLEDKDKNTNKSKHLLKNGITIAKQSNLSSSKELLNECVSTGAQLSIEKNNSAKKAASVPKTAGLLILLISPN
ncbi:MAG: hypothetical protein OEQ24_05055 [Gammaproteobacteria bacterium]|nr:hypothetical protein [Gammaproteobacteria bacterium]